MNRARLPWNGDRLDFDLLSRRLVTAPPALSARWPSSYVAFDVLARDATDLRSRPWTVRREQLVSLAPGWRAPLQLAPATKDPAAATTRFGAYAEAGVEGLVVEPLRSRYTPGRHTWVKVKHRQTHEMIVGGVLGPIRRPRALAGVRGVLAPSTGSTRAHLQAVCATPDGLRPFEVRGAEAPGAARSRVPRPTA